MIFLGIFLKLLNLPLERLLKKGDQIVKTEGYEDERQDGEVAEEDSSEVRTLQIRETRMLLDKIRKALVNFKLVASRQFSCAICAF